MAIAFVNETHALWSAGSIISLPAQSHTAGNLILVAVGTDSNLNVSSVTDTAGNTYQAAYTGVRQGANNWCTLWYAKNITGNAGNVVVVHLTGTPGSGRAAALQYSGADTSAPIDEAPGGNYQSSTSAPSLPAWTSGVDGECVVVASYINPSRTWTVDANYTLRAFGGAGTICVQDRLNAPSTSQTWQDTLSSSTSYAATCGVALIPGAPPYVDPNLPYLSSGFPLHAVTDTGPGGSSFSLTTSTYSVPANAVLLAFTSDDWGGTTVTMSNPTMGSGSIAWTQLQSDNTQGSVGTITAWKGIATAGGCTGVTTRAVFSSGNIAHLYVCCFENGQISDVGRSAKAVATTSSTPAVNIDPAGSASSLLVAFGWNPGSGGARVLRLGEWVDASQLHVWLQKFACTDSTVKTMGLQSPSYGAWGMVTVEILAGANVLWAPPPCLPGRNPRIPDWVQRGFTVAPVGDNTALVVVPRLTPAFYGPPRQPRPSWNPPRSFTFYVNDVPGFDLGRPVPPMLPGRNPRPPWNPERSMFGMPLLPISLAVVTPIYLAEFYGPGRHPRPAWNPPRAQAWNDYFPRLPWDPGGRYGEPWRPCLPDRNPRPAWVPVRSSQVFPPAIASAFVVRGPGDAMASRAFSLTLEINNSASSDNLMVIDVQPFFMGGDPIPGYFSEVFLPSRASMPTTLSALYSASGMVLVRSGESMKFSFDCVCNRPGTISVGVRVISAIHNDLARVRQTIHNPITRICEPATVRVRSITG